MYQGVCFFPEKHALFNDISKDDNNTGIDIKRFRSSENNEDIFINDFSSVKKIEANFERKDFQRKPFTVQQVINECAIYDIVDISKQIEKKVHHYELGKVLCKIRQEVSRLYSLVQ